MKKTFQLPQLIKDTDPEFRKSLLLIYGVILFLATAILGLLLYFMYDKNNKIDILAYASRQRMYSQKIALDVTIHSETDSTSDTELIQSDLEKMKENSNKIRQYLKKIGQYDSFASTFEQTDIYFQNIHEYIDKKNRENASKVREHTAKLYPSFEQIVRLFLEGARHSDRKALLMMIVFVCFALIIFMFVTIYKIIPYIKKYNQNHKDILDSQYKLQIATESASLGIYKYDMSNNKLEWDSETYRIFEIDETTEQITYEKWCACLSKEELEEATTKLAESIESGDSFHHEIKIKTPKGNEKWISTSGVAIKDKNGSIEVIGVNTDVTKLKNIESEILKSRESALRANEAKSEFLANMSHEIRTPLNGIIGLSKMISETPLARKQRDYVDRIISSSELLLQIVNDILDFSKIEANRLSLASEEFELDNVFNKLSNMFGYAAYSKKIELLFFIDPDLPSKLLGDELRITQILVNLLSNALKFTEKGQIRVYAQSLGMDEKNVEIGFKVIDSGIGMSKEKQSKIFTEFEQGDNTTSKRYGGTGLGLVICKKLIDMMGGNINFNSNEGLGSEFRCNFTLKRASSNNENPDSYQSIERANILIIAEISEKIEYIVSLLNRKKCNVNVVHPSKWQQHLDKIQDAGRIILEWKSYVTERPFFNHVATNEELSKKIVLLVSEYAKTELGSLLQLPNNLNINFIPEPFIPSDVYFVICKQQAKPMRISHTKQLVLKDSKTCLLVEDNETNQIIAADILTKIGFKVDLAENGFEAVNKAAKGKYDIILMDIHMPVMDGYEATRIIRKIDPSIPIVGLTASVLEKDKKDSSNAGFNFHLGKPINLQELDVVVSNYFEVKYLEQEGGEAGREVEPAEEANEHKILNMKYLNETFSDKEFIRILLLSFLETYDSIDTDWSNTDANSEDARVKVHTLKGVTGNLHIHKIHEEAKTFEIQIGSSSKKEILDNLIRLVVSLNKEIKEELSH